MDRQPYILIVDDDPDILDNIITVLETQPYRLNTARDGRQCLDIIKHEVPIVFTSAGNPKTCTQHLKDHGITVVHVVSSLKFALKAQEAGVDAVVAEGFEAGGHNGRDETTTLCLIPMVAKELEIPFIDGTKSKVLSIKLFIKSSLGILFTSYNFVCLFFFNISSII